MNKVFIIPIVFLILLAFSQIALVSNQQACLPCYNKNSQSGGLSRPDNDHVDDNYSQVSPRAVEGLVESLNPEVLVLKHGFWQEAGAYMNKLGKRFSYIEPDQGPLEMKE